MGLLPRVSAGKKAAVRVPMAGQPIPGAEEVAQLRADPYRFDFVIAGRAAGNWSVTYADWRRRRQGAEALLVSG